MCNSSDYRRCPLNKGSVGVNFGPKWNCVIPYMSPHIWDIYISTDCKGKFPIRCVEFKETMIMWCSSERYSKFVRYVLVLVSYGIIVRGVQQFKVVQDFGASSFDLGFQNIYLHNRLSGTIYLQVWNLEDFYFRFSGLWKVPESW